jgi:rubrerythrin
MEQATAAAPEEASGERRALDRLGDPTSRKRFLRMAGGAGAAGALATLTAACGERETPIGVTQRDPGTVAEFGPGDIGIVNFALLLEYVEQEFYEQVRKSGEVGGRLAALIDDIYANEVEHTRALERVAEQMGRPIRRPKIEVESVLADGQDAILEESASLENLGAAAYLGQAARISDTQVLAAALSIHTVEARHAAALNELAGRGFSGDGALSGSIPNGAFAKPMTMQQVMKRVRRFVPGGVPKLESPGG